MSFLSAMSCRLYSILLSLKNVINIIGNDKEEYYIFVLFFFRVRVFRLYIGCNFRKSNGKRTSIVVETQGYICGTKCRGTVCSQ